MASSDAVRGDGAHGPSSPVVGAPLDEWGGHDVATLAETYLAMGAAESGAKELLAGLVQRVRELEADAAAYAETAKMQREWKEEAEAALAVVRQSLRDQAEARADPTMPVLTATVLEQLRADAEANYAMAETREERVVAHGLSLLCDWQAKAVRS